jgi:serine protease AprX
MSIKENKSVSEKTLIKLRSLEFDPKIEVPVAPASMMLRETEMVSPEGIYWIVQFVAPVKPEWVEAVQEHGGSVGDYVPDNAFLVQMTPLVKDQVEKLDFVRWIGPYQAAYKINPLLIGVQGKIPLAALRDAAISESFKAKPFVNIRVLLHKADDAASVKLYIEKLSGTVLSTDQEALRVSIDPAHIEALARLPNVQWIEPYSLQKLVNDIAAGILGVQPVWNNHGLDGQGQIVAVADSGLDVGVNNATMHDDFEGRIVAIHSWPMQQEWWAQMNNPGADDGAADLGSGHGTHVAGSVLGSGARSNGSIRGMAFNAQLVFQAVDQWCDIKTQYEKYWPDGDNYYLVGLPNDLNTLFLQSYNDGARIFSNSWGGAPQDALGNPIFGQYTSESQDIDEFVWNHKDALILFAAGNSGQDGNSDGVIDSNSLLSEATAKNCISVGGCENNRPHGSTPAPGLDKTYGAFGYTKLPISTDHISDNPDGMVAFSSRGPTVDNRIKPDVIAPGTNILSVRSSVAAEHGWGLLPTGDARRDFYMFMGGTSMSTPITAGTAALIRQYLQNAYLISPSAALIKAMLIHGAVPMAGQYAPPEVGGVPNNDEGWGRINLGQTLFLAYPSKLEVRDLASDAIGTGEQKKYMFSVVNNTVPFRATLVWTDYASTPAAVGIVNQLQLSITAPDGITTQGIPSNNNVQQVVLNTPQIGIYTVSVTGINVPTVSMPGVNQKQDFALVVTGGLEFVDVYIKDNPADDGIPPSTGCLYQSPDIWVSLNNDPIAQPALNPEYGQTNYVFVRVHNRGSKAANDAEVKLYWANPGTNLSKPFWKTDGIKVDGIAGNTRKISVPAHGAGGDGKAITAAFEWEPPALKENPVEPGHFCLFATVNHPEDPIVQEDVDKVNWEDNLAWKNEIVQDQLADSTSSAEFYMAGIPGPSIGELYIDSKSGPTGGEVSLAIPSRYLEGASAIGLNKIWESEHGQVSKVALPTGAYASLTRIKLKSKENTLIRIEVKLPPGARSGDVYPVFVEQRVNGKTTGRVSLVARVVGTPAYIANSNPESLEIHLPNCQWAKKISGRHKIPYNDLELALRRGYNGCKFCLPKYSTD